MTDVLDSLTRQFGDDVVNSISGQTGIDRAQAGSVLGSALPILLAALARNSSQNQGAQDLHRALERDHDGSILNDLGGFIQNANQGAGASILEHVLGSRQPAVEQAISRQTGVNTDAIANILKIAAPILLGMLGRQQRSNHMDPGGLADLLSNSNREITRRSPQTGGFLTQILDQDGDGDISDDVTNIGIDLLGRFMK